MINIIGWLNPIVDLNHAAQESNHILLGYSAVWNRDIQVQLLIQLVTTNALKIIMTLIEQLLLKELAGIIERGRIAGSHFAEELNQRGFSNSQATGKIPLRFLF